MRDRMRRAGINEPCKQCPDCGEFCACLRRTVSDRATKPLSAVEERLVAEVTALRARVAELEGALRGCVDGSAPSVSEEQVPERERCARHCEVLAHFLENGAGPRKAPSARLRQAAASIRGGKPASLWLASYSRTAGGER